MNLSTPSLTELAWISFKRNRAAYRGLWLVFLLFDIAVLAPIIANNKPFILLSNQSFSFPLFKSLDSMDWRFLIDGIGLLLLFLFRKRFSRGLKFKMVLFLLIGVEIFCCLKKPFLDTVNYRNLEGVFKIMPPIPYSPYEQTLENFTPPSWKHWFGTDSLGRDITSRMLHGARISLSVGFVAVSIYLSIGTILGALAGYYRGKYDLIISRIIEIMECFPTFFLILAVIAFLPASLLNIMIVIGITSWTGVARLVRGEFLKLSVQPFALSAMALGASDVRVICRHILPNAMGPILVSATFGIASAILVESSLSFLGFGIQPPTPSWGDILSESRRYIDFAWWLATFPGLAIFITITAYNLVGEGLRDAIDPRMKL